MNNILDYLAIFHNLMYYNNKYIVLNDRNQLNNFFSLSQSFNIYNMPIITFWDPFSVVIVIEMKREKYLNN